MRNRAVLICLVVLTVTTGASGQSPIPRLSYHFKPDRMFGYALLMTCTVGNQTEYVGGLVTFKVIGKESEDTRYKLLVRDDLQIGQHANLLKPRLPQGSRFLPQSVFANRIHGVRPTSNNDLPHMLGHAVEWFFPPLPKGVGRSYEREGMVPRTAAVWISSHFEYNSEAVSKSGDVVRIEDNWLLTSENGVRVEGKGTIDFDERLSQVKRRTMRCVQDTVAGARKYNILIITLTPEQLEALPRD